MSCFIQLTNDISKLEVFFYLVKLEFEVDKSNRALSVDAADFFKRCQTHLFTSKYRRKSYKNRSLKYKIFSGRNVRLHQKSFKKNQPEIINPLL